MNHQSGYLQKVQEERDAIEELLWMILTHNTEGRKHPLDDLVQMVHSYSGRNKDRLGRALVNAFVEAADYGGLNEPDPVEDPIALAFRAMGEDVARAHRTH